MEKLKVILEMGIGALAWLSLLMLLWGILWGWFPGSTWLEQIIAGAIFALVGIIVTPLSTQLKKDNGD